MMQFTPPNPAGRAASVLTILTCAVCIMLAPSLAHAVAFVEGNCGGRPQTETVPGACGDYDGDGRLGTAEDTDGDGVFGTITAALLADNRDITIVTSGVFFESLRIIDPASSITLQAAPGVAAILTNAPGSLNIGITIDVTRSNIGAYVVLRNLCFSRRLGGILVRGNSRVAIEGCRIEHSDLYGISVRDNSKVTVVDTEVHATRIAFEDDVLDHTFGIIFLGQSSGTIFSTTVSGTDIGISNRFGTSNAVCAYNVNVFDNVQNFENITPSSVPCGSAAKGRTFGRH